MTGKLTSPVTAADVTEEMIKEAVEIANGWHQNEYHIDWERLFERLEGMELADGTELDLGSDWLSPALAKLKRAVLKRRDYEG